MNTTKRIVNEAGEEYLFKTMEVLPDGMGSLTLTDYSGNDSTIVNAARVSYGPMAVKKRTDNELIDYLLRNGHTSPFEQPNLTFHVKMPIFVARQWVRHRTAKLNEISARYSILPDEFYVPNLQDFRMQSNTNKQGSSEAILSIEAATECRDAIIRNNREAYQLYTAMLNQGMAQEQARAVLPVSIYTEWIWQIDLHNLLHFLQLRMDKHAQQEIRTYATSIGFMVSHIYPATWASFDNHKLKGIRITSEERDRLVHCFDDPGVFNLSPALSKKLRGY